MSARLTPGPPRLAAWLFRKLFPDRGLATPCGDMEEIFLAHVAAFGPRRARRWYRIQLLRALPSRLLAVFVLDLPMLAVSLKIQARGLRKHKAFSALSGLALVFGLACFFLIFLYVRYESTYDSFHPAANRIYRLRVESPPGDKVDQIPLPEPALLAARIPQIEAVATVCRAFNPVVKIGKAKFETTGVFAGEDFLRMFRFPLRRGETRALSEPGRVLLTASAARRFFGRDDPMGRTLDFVIRGENAPLTVAGILADPPTNSHFAFDLLISGPTARSLPGFADLLVRMGVGLKSASFGLPYIYIKLNRNTTVSSALAGLTGALNPEAASTASGPGFRPELQPLSDIHLRPDGKDDHAVRALYLFLALSFLILAVAVTNYVNLATSRCSSRMREVGVRKTIGAHRLQLVRQFLGEAFILTAASFLLSLAALALLLPAFNRLVERDIDPGAFFLGLAGWQSIAVLALVVLGAGLYPAFLLASARPARILKEAGVAGGASSRLRNALVVAQFAAAVGLVIVTLCVRGQIRYMLGGAPSGSGLVVETWTGGPESGRLIRDRLLSNPRVAAVTLASNQSFLSNRKELDERYGKVVRLQNGAKETLEGGVFHLKCDQAFFDVFNIGLRRGRLFDDRADAPTAAVINETLARRLGGNDPIGTALQIGDQALTIIGIVGDFHIQPFLAPIAPMILSPAGDNTGVLYARFSGGPPKDALAAVQEAVDQFTPDDVLTAELMEDRIAAIYKPERRQADLLSIFSTLVVIIAGLGIVGLAMFSVERRTREIGIRKVLGAGTGRLYWLLAGRFAGLLAIASLIGAPLAFYLASGWLENFVYGIPVRASYFLAAVAGMLILVLLTAGTQVSKIVRISPARTLRSE